jgi:hypothetical protein
MVIIWQSRQAVKALDALDRRKPQERRRRPRNHGLSNLAPQRGFIPTDDRARVRMVATSDFSGLIEFALSLGKRGGQGAD